MTKFEGLMTAFMVMIIGIWSIFVIDLSKVQIVSHSQFRQFYKADVSLEERGFIFS
jgi:hypothetical protein